MIGRFAYLAKSGLEVTSGIMLPETELIPVMKAHPSAEDERDPVDNLDVLPSPPVLPTTYPNVAIKTGGATILLIVYSQRERDGWINIKASWTNQKRKNAVIPPVVVPADADK